MGKKNAEKYKTIVEADEAFHEEHPELDICDEAEYYRLLCNWLMSA